jgi:hypothetical protein
MSEYSYSSLSPEPYTIRLLRILPSNEASKNVRCELFEYTLRISDTAVHPYEALSYVWGSKENAKAVEIDNRTISVANNLYTALLRFRDPKIPRIIWADAICINQKDQREKESQIQLMAAVYAKASRVIVWLGQAEDGGDRALETIRRVGESSTSDPELPQREILLLLQRPWFQRIWVWNHHYTVLVCDAKSHLGSTRSRCSSTCLDHMWFRRS